MMIVEKTLAVVRATPSIRGGVLRTLGRGSRVEIAERHSGWAQLRDGGWLPLSKLVPAHPADAGTACMNGTPEPQTPDLELVANRGPHA